MWERETEEEEERQRKRKKKCKEMKKTPQYRTFLQTHVYHARLGQLQEEVLVFLILLIVNNFHVNKFAARRGRGRGRGGTERGEERRRRERLICDGGTQEVLCK